MPYLTSRIPNIKNKLLPIQYDVDRTVLVITAARVWGGLALAAGYSPYGLHVACRALGTWIQKLQMVCQTSIYISHGATQSLLRSLGMTGVNSFKSPNFFTHPGGVNWSIFRQNFFWFNLLFVRVYNSLPQASLPLRQVLKSPWFMKGVLDI